MTLKMYGKTIVGIAGVSNSGKTRVVSQVVKKLSDRGYKVATIKHDGHGFDLDHPGKDTYLHKEAGAKMVTIASRRQYAQILQTEHEEVSLDQLIENQIGMDIVLVEGYKFSSLPKFEVIRRERSTEGVCRMETLIGRITDIKGHKDEVPSYGLNEVSYIADVIEKIYEVTHERL